MMMPHFSFIHKQIFTTLFAILLAIQHTFSQPQNFELKQISEEHGLPGVNVRAIFQDSKHILWFGIESTGLCRYDGVNFTLYSNNSKDSSSLGNNFVNTICEDADGYLWIGTEEGLFRFNRLTEKFNAYSPVKNNKNSLYGNQIYATEVDVNGKLWIGTNKGLNIYNKSNNSFIQVPYIEKGKELNFQVNSLCFDTNKNIWLGTSEGLFKLDCTSNKYTRWINVPKQPNSLPNNQIKDLCFDQQGLLWIITGVGCVKFDQKQNQFYTLKELKGPPFTSIYGSPVAMMRDSRGFIWIGAEGLAIVDPKNDTHKIFQKSYDDPTGLKQNDIRAIYEDKSGLIWIGTKFEGLQIYNYRKELFPHVKNQIENNHKGLNDKYVFSICEDQSQNIWVGTRDGGLNLFDRQTGKFTYFTHDKNNPASISENNITYVIADHKNNLWVATSNFLEKFDIERKAFTHFPIKGIWSLLEDSRGRLWVGKQGLFIFDKTKCTLKAFHDSSKVFPEKNDLDIYKLFQDREENLWIGTYRDGLFEYNLKSGKIIQYKNNPKDPTSLSNDRIRCIYEDKKDRLWIGTRLQGLNLLDRTNKKFTRYTTNDGLPSNSIYSILEDSQGNLWLATHNGISKFTPESKKFENYNKDFGLQDNIFVLTAYCKSKSGELIFGGNNGFNIFRPEKIKKEVYASPLIISSVKVYDQIICRDVSKPVNITLPYKKNYLSFSFALLDYSDPLKNQYQYKLENIDNKWIDCGNRHYAAYSNLPPGNYSFSVKAENAYGIWNENGVAVTITILPPWWKTWWFRGLIMLLLLTTIYFAYSLRVKFYRKKQQMLVTLVKQRTFEIAQANGNLLERQTQIEEQAENLKKANGRLMDNHQLIEAQAQQLKNTNQQLSILNSTKDRLFTIIAHDLRNPFQIVKGFAEILMKDYKKLPFEKIDKFLSMIYTSSNNGSTLLENLLQWSRLQTGRLLYDPTHVAITPIVCETLSLLEANAIQKNITIRQLIDTELIVFVDENMLKTVLRNLISNAIKFTPNGGFINLKATSDSKQVEICVEDTGIGIPPDILPLLFQIENTISTQGTAREQGTGLGLIVCKEFIEKHNGKIWVESIEDKGSQFKFTLPNFKQIQQ